MSRHQDVDKERRIEAAECLAWVIAQVRGSNAAGWLAVGAAMVGCGKPPCAECESHHQLVEVLDSRRAATRLLKSVERKFAKGAAKPERCRTCGSVWHVRTATTKPVRADDKDGLVAAVEDVVDRLFPP